MLLAIGFTGTRGGMSYRQEVTVRELLRTFRPLFGTEFRHGAAEGADVQSAKIAKEEGYEPLPFPAGDDPLGRNRVIVDGSGFLIAVPRGNAEELLSGTWATVRYARKKGVPGLIVWPSGACTPLTATRAPC